MMLRFNLMVMLLLTAFFFSSSAAWALSVTYNGNSNSSGSVPTDSAAYSTGNSVTVLGNSGSLAKSGFVFNGWNTVADGSGTSYTVGATFVISVDTVLYARWAAAITPPAGVIGWWRGEENIVDSVGGNTGTLNGATFVTGKVGQAFSFNGSSNYITQATSYKGIASSSGSSSFTMEFWAKPTATITNLPASQTTIGHDGVSGQRYAIFPWKISGSATEAGAGISVGTNGIVVTEYADDYLPAPLVYPLVAGDIPGDGWLHIAVVYESQTPMLYVNGTLKQTGLSSSRTVYPSSAFGETGLGYGYYSGLLDEVHIFNRALTVTEIQGIYNAGSAGLAAPAITGIAPSSGLFAGGTTVTVTGANLSGATTVMFGSTSATIVSNSATQIVATAPAGSVGTVHITVTTTAGTSATSSADQFTYVRFVDLNDGTLLDMVSSLRWLKNANCYGMQSWDTAISSATSLASGLCGLTDGSTADDWHLPTITELRNSTDAGYRNDTLNTAGFTNVQSNYYWSSNSFFNYTEIVWVVHMGDGYVYPYGKGNSYFVWPVRSGQYWLLGSLVMVGTADFGSQIPGSVSSGHQFTLKNSGAATLPITSIALGGANANQFTLDHGGTSPCASLAPTLSAGASCTVLVAAKPTSDVAKSATLTVTTADGSKDVPLTVSVYVPPTITAVSPSVGSAFGGTLVTITGSNLTGASSVNFGSIAATGVTAVSATQVTTVSPSSVAGQTVDITVTTPGGTSVASSADQFTYTQDQAKNQTTGTVYALLSGAITNALSGAEIRSYGSQFAGAFALDKGLALKGGYDSAFQAKSGIPTTLNNSLTVTAGDSTAETVAVKGKLAVQGGSLRVREVRVQP